MVSGTISQNDARYTSAVPIFSSISATQASTSSSSLARPRRWRAAASLRQRTSTSPQASMAASSSGMREFGTATRQVPAGRCGGERQTEREAMRTPSSDSAASAAEAGAVAGCAARRALSEGMEIKLERGRCLWPCLGHVLVHGVEAMVGGSAHVEQLRGSAAGADAAAERPEDRGERWEIARSGSRPSRPA